MFGVHFEMLTDIETAATGEDATEQMKEVAAITGS